MSALSPPRPSRSTARSAEDWLEAIPLAVLGVDASLGVRYVNGAAADLLAQAVGGLLGRTLEDIFGRGSALADLAQRAFERNAPVSARDLVLDGPGFFIGAADVHANPIEEGRAVALALAPRPRSVSELETRPISAVARKLAHEVRNPLAGIRAAAQLIAKSDPGEIAELTALIIAEADRIRRLTDRIGAVEELPPPRLQATNIHEALDRVRRIIGSSFPDVTIAERFDPSLPAVQGDLDQLIQAFLNIAKNAAEALSKTQSPAIVFATRYRSGVRLRAAAGGAARGLIEASIEDNGPGLPPEIRQRVFEPFVTTKRRGMGLGLAVTGEIIARHDGRIEVESQPGRTVFRVLLPIEGGAH